MIPGSVSRLLIVFTIGLCVSGAPALGADYRAAIPPVIEGEGPAEIPVTPGYGLDPRCRIIPNPQMSIVGDVSSFNPIAVCQSRGLYADSATIPYYWFPFTHR